MNSVGRFDKDHDDYNSIMAKALRIGWPKPLPNVSISESGKSGDMGKHEQLTNDELIREQYRGIRPAPGYPACPDHTEKRLLFDLLSAEKNSRHHPD